MYIINQEKIQSRFRERGYRSISELAAHLSIHRNTIQGYLAGLPVINSKLELLLDFLDVDLKDVIEKKEKHPQFSYEPVAELVDLLHKEFMLSTFVLFGSRARKSNHKYSDWDIGVYKSAGLSHAEFRKMALLKSEWAEQKPFFVDLVNLNSADFYFIHNISQCWQFLTGSLKDWIDLNRKAAAYEKK